MIAALMSDMVFGDMFSELKSGGFGYGLGVSVLCHPADGFNYNTYIHTYILTCMIYFNFFSSNLIN